MKANRVAVVGLGSLGSHVAIELAKVCNELVLVDHDMVEEKNIEKSTYRDEHIGMYKTDALEQIVRPTKVQNIPQKFIEGKVKLPKCDLTIDCRDYLYSRQREIDVRLYISGRNLVIDHRKYVKYEIERQGFYEYEVKTKDLELAANSFIQCMMEDHFLTRTQPRLINLIVESPYPILNPYDYQEDTIYDTDPPGLSKILNAYEYIPLLIKENRNNPMRVYIGYYGQPGYTSRLVNQEDLKSPRDVTHFLVDMVNLSYRDVTYIIQTKQHPTGIVVEMIPETGAA